MDILLAVGNNAVYRWNNKTFWGILCVILIDFLATNDIIILRYNDIIWIEGRCGLLSDRTKQVQFRMPDELHTELKAALAYDRSSFADFFNKAAEEYLSNRMADKRKKSKSKNGGTQNDAE